MVSDSLWPHGLQHTRPPCPSTTPRACSHSCPSRRWYHPTISSSVTPFSSCLQSFPVPGSFPVSQFSASGGQSIGVSASTSVLPMNIQDWFPLGLTGLIFQSKGLSPGLLHCRQILYQLSHKRSRIILITNILLYITGSSPSLNMPWYDLRRKCCIISHFCYVLLFATLWTVAHQAPLSKGFSRQEYWSGLPCPPPVELPKPGIKSVSLASPALAGKFFTPSDWQALKGKNSGTDFHYNFRYYIKICDVKISRWKCHFTLLWGKFSNLDNFTHVLYGWFKVKNSRGECISRKLLWTPASLWHRKSFYLELNLLIQTTDEATTGPPFIVWDLQVCISAWVLQQKGFLLLCLGVFVQLFLFKHCEFPESTEVLCRIFQL